jgi:hypothetical protein
LHSGGAAVWRGYGVSAKASAKAAAAKWRRRRADEELAANSNILAKAEMAKGARQPGGYLVAFDKYLAAAACCASAGAQPKEKCEINGVGK